MKEKPYADWIYVSSEWQENYNKLDPRQKQIVNEYFEECRAKVMREIDDEIIRKINQCSDPDCEPHNYCEKCCPRKKLEDV